MINKNPVTPANAKGSGKRLLLSNDISDNFIHLSS